MEDDKTKKGISLHFSSLFTGRENCRNQQSCWGFLRSLLASCQSALTSLHQWEWHTHTQTHIHKLTHTCKRTIFTCKHAVPCNLLSPNYSRLEPMLLSLILSVRGLWGNSDISVWCLPYVSRALPGPIKLIFNVRPTLDGPSQGWHSSRGDMIGVW